MREVDRVLVSDGMPKILMLVSSAKVIGLADGTPHPTGCFVDETIKPYDRFVAAGAAVMVATVDGQLPHPDPYGLEHFFHYPDEDEDFLASVTRTFKREEDQTRLGRRGMPWYVETALKNAGAIFDDAGFAWTSHVVVDRNLIAGQNPASSDAAADAVLKRIGLLDRSAA